MDTFSVLFDESRSNIHSPFSSDLVSINFWERISGSLSVCSSSLSRTLPVWCTVGLSDCVSWKQPPAAAENKAEDTLNQTLSDLCRPAEWVSLWVSVSDPFHIIVFWFIANILNKLISAALSKWKRIQNPSLHEINYNFINKCTCDFVLVPNSMKIIHERNPQISSSQLLMFGNLTENSCVEFQNIRSDLGGKV